MFRIGIGYDLHRLVGGRALILGGVRIDYDKGLHGHSDGDVLTHAVIDALLGAAALGNIGQHFPDTDPAFKGADSLLLLRETVKRIAKAGYSVANVDAVIVAERPKLNPHIDAMRKTLAEAMGIVDERISVKPKTNEGVGPEGLGEAISAQAVALLEQP